MVLSRTALRRVGQPADVAGCAVFLASDESAYVTGEVLTVDGGWSMS
jgi:NAD(P)-dependent dehydrogenase (short-subunit alcohol dehydrogenase family)